MRLLIIEDDKELALLMKDGLEKRGFTVDIAESQYLKESVITATAGVAGDGIKAVDEDNNTNAMGGFPGP
ncbi:MAG TPA: response regulator transcription factor [Peptococcaceae bacterium]|nr:response regulator transcription factor [Peptococcaceae bacterium]